MPKLQLTIEDAILELKRELNLRKRVYPKWIQEGKLSKKWANRQYLALQKALELLEEKEQQPEVVQGELFENI